MYKAKALTYLKQPVLLTVGFVNGVRCCSGERKMGEKMLEGKEMGVLLTVLAKRSIYFGDFSHCKISVKIRLLHFH